MRSNPTRLCRRCGVSFSAKPSTLGLYCNISCANKARWPSRAERFWAKVDRSNPDDCWPWLGARFQHPGQEPYGAFWDGKNNRPAHQVAWEIANDSPFPEGKQGNHTCDLTLCCRPDHVIPGTQADNMADMVQRDRSLHGDRHPMRKVTQEQVREIRRRAEAGEKLRSLAAAYGLTSEYVGEIVRRESWARIT